MWQDVLESSAAVNNRLGADWIGDIRSPMSSSDDSSFHGLWITRSLLPTSKWTNVCYRFVPILVRNRDSFHRKFALVIEVHLSF